MEACPVDGVCSECGLAFAWVDVLRPDHRRLRGFVEDEAGAIRVFVAAWRTWWWTLLPGRFWRRVRLERPVRTRRLALWLLLAYGTWHVVSAAAACAGMGVGWWHGAVFPRGSHFFNACFAPFLTYDYSSGGAWWGGGRRGGLGVMVGINPAVWALLGASACMPLVLTALPFTRARAKVRVAQVLRGGVYGLAWLVLLSLVNVAFDAVHAAYMAGGPLPRRGGLLASVLAWLNTVEWRLWWVWGMVLMAWLMRWWWVTLARGYRLERPGPVFAAMAVASLLAGAAAMLIGGQWWVQRWFM